jgi:hypothetical protein
MTHEQFLYLDELKKALEKIANDKTEGSDYYKVGLYRLIAKKALEVDDED